MLFVDLMRKTFSRIYIFNYYYYYYYFMFFDKTFTWAVKVYKFDRFQ